MYELRVAFSASRSRHRCRQLAPPNLPSVIGGTQMQRFCFAELVQGARSEGASPMRVDPCLGKVGPRTRSRRTQHEPRQRAMR